MCTLSSWNQKQRAHIFKWDIVILELYWTFIKLEIDQAQYSSKKILYGTNDL